jgi:CheY-like chemotaxis protein
LAISKRLSELMGGTMWAESSGMNKGATFAFTIQAEPAPLSTERIRLMNAQPALQGKRILIVDDNAARCLILSAQTKKWGMSPRDTQSAKQAIHWVETGEIFDLALLDMQMPEMNGIELARRIRASGATFPLALFDSVKQRDAEEDEHLFSAYPTKPIKQSQFLDLLTGMFGKIKGEDKKAAGQFKLDPDLAARHPLRILLAEDNIVNQKLALHLLKQMSYSAEVAANGREAIEALKNRIYDVILMDVQMPEMDGLEATRLIRSTKEFAQPHIIGLTANAMQGDRALCLAAGMDDYITKPIRVNELVDALLKAKKLN